MNSFESSRLEYATQREAEELYGPSSGGLPGGFGNAVDGQI
jgi:hypothetical protein